MNIIKYFCMQFILISILILTNFYLGDYIQKPFTYTDLIAIIIGTAILMLCFSIYNKLAEHLTHIRLYLKIFVSVFAIFFAIIFIGAITGEIQF